MKTPFASRLHSLAAIAKSNSKAIHPHFRCVLLKDGNGIALNPYQVSTIKLSYPLSLEGKRIDVECLKTLGDCKRILEYPMTAIFLEHNTRNPNDVFSNDNLRKIFDSFKKENAVRVGFTKEYLMAALESMDSDQVVFEIQENSNSLVRLFGNGKESEGMAYVMPIRLS